MNAPSYNSIRQDVRRELGHGDRLEKDIEELHRKEVRLNSGTLTAREQTDEAYEYYEEAMDVAYDLRTMGYDKLAEYVERRAEKHHPDQYYYSGGSGDRTEMTAKEYFGL